MLELKNLDTFQSFPACLLVQLAGSWCNR